MSEFRRRLMMVGGGGLPYDAEVEYLESTGTQWIDTGVSVNYDNMPTYYADIEFTVLYTSDNNIICGAYDHNGADARRYFIFVGSDGKWKASFKNVINTTATAQVGVRYEFDYYFRNGLQEFNINSSQVSRTTTSVSGAYINSPCAIFGAYYRGSIISLSKMKLRKFTITYRVSGNEVTMFDGIPVRVGQTGYLYDNVSGQLFGNSGTGSFVIGNDVNT